MFGKTQRGVSERPNKPKKPLVPKWLGMLVAILAVLCAGVMLMLWQPWQPVPAKNQVRSEHYQEEDTNKDYRFYDLLPQQQVTPIPEQAVPEPLTMVMFVVGATGVTHEKAAVHPGLLMEPSEVNTNVKHPEALLVVAVITGGIAVPEKVPNKGAEVFVPS